jgi:hypothetical protein
MSQTEKLLRESLASAEIELRAQRYRTRAAMRDANQAWATFKQPDAILRDMLAELVERVDQLQAENELLRNDLAHVLRIVPVDISLAD